MEDFNKRVAGWCAESCLNVSKGEAEGDEHDIAECAVQYYSPHHGFGEDVRGVSDLFSWGQG